jgi:hypothetical protein
VSKYVVSFVIISSFTPPALWAQQSNATAQPAPVATAAPLRIDSVRKVDPGNMYHRVYARVPLIGAGTPADPKRPMFIPAPGQPTATAVHTGILAYQMQISDDGKWALCEFVGATPQDLQIITLSNNANVVFFERGKATLAEVLADFQQYKKNYTFPTFTTRAQ